MAIIKPLEYRSFSSLSSEDNMRLSSRDFETQDQRSLAMATTSTTTSTTTTPPPVDFILVIVAIICLVEVISLARKWFTARRARHAALLSYQTGIIAPIPKIIYTEFSSEKACAAWRGETDGDDDDELNWSVV